MNPVVLHLFLRYHWFDEMTAGRKDIEYREVRYLWKRQIWDRRDKITHCRFHRGYTSTTILRPVLRVDQGLCPYDGWTGPFYRLHLGPILENAGSEASNDR